MHSAPAYFDPQLVKGDILQYCKGLIATVENNHALAEQSFCSVIPGDEDLEHHTLYPEISSIGRDISRKTLFSTVGKAPVR